MGCCFRDRMDSIKVETGSNKVDSRVGKMDFNKVDSKARDSNKVDSRAVNASRPQQHP